jgi:hypothetical protein
MSFSFGRPGRHAVEAYPWLKHVPAMFSPWKREALNQRQRDIDLYMGLYLETKDRVKRGVSPPCFARSMIETGHEKLGMTELDLAYTCGTPCAYRLLCSTTWADRIASRSRGRRRHGAQISSRGRIARLTFERSLPAPSSSSSSPALTPARPSSHKLRKSSTAWSAAIAYRSSKTSSTCRIASPSLPNACAGAPSLSSEVRHLPPNPMSALTSVAGQPHATSADDTYQSYFIPKGATVIASLWSIHLNETDFPDPHRFDPNRFLDEKRRASYPGAFGHSSFGFGRRICPGLYLGSNSVQLNVRWRPLELPSSLR